MKASLWYPTTSATIKGVIWHLKSGTRWNGTALVEASTIADAAWTTGMVSMVEKETSDSTGTCLYVGDLPAGLPGGHYEVRYYLGASPLPGDRSIGEQLVVLDGGDGVLLEAEVATVTSQTVFTMSRGLAANDAYNGQMIVLYDDSAGDLPCVRRVVDYVGATRTVTINEAADFTLAADDSVRIYLGTNARQINGSTLAAQVLAARNYSHAEDSATVPEISNTSTGRAANLRASLAAAQAMTPGGDALAAGNRAIALVPPAIYDFATGDGSNHGLELDAQYVDLVGLGNRRDDVVLTSQIATASRGTVEQSVSDVRIANLTMDIDSTYGVVNDSTDPAAYWPASNLANARLDAVHCLTRDDDEAHATRIGIEYSGRYVGNKITGEHAFGGSQGTHSGEFWDNELYGDYALGGGCTGLFVRNYLAGDNVLGDSSGEFIENTTVGTGARYAMSGKFIREMHIGDNGFGGSSSIPLGGYTGASVSGTMIDCLATGTNPTLELTSAVVVGCSLRIKNYYIGETVPAIRLLDSGSVVMNSALHHEDSAAVIIASDGSSRSVAAVGNTYSNSAAAAKGLGSDVTNLGCDGSNDFSATTDGSVIADAVLSRDVNDMSGTPPLESLASMAIHAKMRFSDVAGGKAIKMPNGTTIGIVKTITASAADPIVGTDGPG